MRSGSKKSSLTLGKKKISVAVHSSSLVKILTGDAAAAVAARANPSNSACLLLWTGGKKLSCRSDRAVINEWMKWNEMKTTESRSHQQVNNKCKCSTQSEHFILSCHWRGSPLCSESGEWGQPTSQPSSQHNARPQWPTLQKRVEGSSCVLLKNE